MNYLKYLNLSNLSSIINIFIIVFLSAYIFTISSLIYNKKSKQFVIELSNIDEFLYFGIFLIMPLIGCIILKSFYKFDSLKIYFFIFVVQWILFLNVNPYPIKLDNKFSIMDLIPLKYRPKNQFLLSNIKNNQFSFPIIIKPIYCSGNGNNIFIFNNSYELNAFLNKGFDNESFMVQNFLHDYNVEIGVLFEKNPFESEGNVIEIVEKTNNEDKIRYFKDNKKINHYDLINNKQINNLFRELSKKIPNMNVARYDIRLKKIGDLINGNFKIIEINGTMGMSFVNYFDVIWYIKRIIIGFFNIVTLKGYSPTNLLIAMEKSCYSIFNCNDYENLYSLYS